MEISIRELKANPGKAIAQVRLGDCRAEAVSQPTIPKSDRLLGQRVQITSHRKVVAELVMPQAEPVAAAPSEDELAMARLLASRLVSQPATLPFRLPKPLKLPPSPDGKTMSDLVIEGRGPG